jgi:hypothetical protein
MARKDRVPNPPKRPQAPQRRQTPTDPTVAARRRRFVLYALGGAGLLTVAVVLGLTFGVDSGKSAAAALEEAGCTLKSAPALPGEHIPSTAKPNWNTNPPTTGSQADSTVIWGSYDDPVSLRSIVHNLEHGGVYILYGADVPEAEVARVRDFYAQDPNGLVVAPLPSLKRSIALGAWFTPDENTPGKGEGKLARCERFDEQAFSKFIDSFGFQGPERAPRDALTPGT